MKTSHIKHVVLYAKNFYRHTGDIVKDLQRFMQMDGVPFKKINTPEKALAVMRKNYLEWVDSLNEKCIDYKHDVEYLRKDADGIVYWASNVTEAHLWHFICIYSNAYIPMNSIIGYPKYDKYHMPQFNIKEGLFDKNGTFEDWNKAAKEFLDVTQEDRCDEYMNNLMDKYPFEELSQIFDAIGVKISAKELSDELWDLYTKFMDDHSCEGGLVTNGYFNLYSDHFYLRIDTTCGGAGFDVEALFGEMTCTSPKEAGIEALKDLFKMIADDEHLFDIFSTVCKKNDEIFANDIYMNKHGEDHATYEWYSKSVMDLCHEFVIDWSGHYTALMKDKRFSIGYGMMWYDFTIREDNTISVTVRFTDVFGCAIMEQELWPYGNSVSCAKY